MDGSQMEPRQLLSSYLLLIYCHLGVAVWFDSSAFRVALAPRSVQESTMVDVQPVQLLAVDALVPATMKNAANCDT
jgi:hypothetical protein